MVNGSEGVLSWTAQLDALIQAYAGLIETYWAEEEKGRMTVAEMFM